MSAPGSAPDEEASKSFLVPSRGRNRRCLRPLCLCQAPQGGLIRRCSFTQPPGGGVIRVWPGTTLGTHPRGRHTSLPFEERYVETRDPPPPAPDGGSWHPSPVGFPPPPAPSPEAACWAQGNHELEIVNLSMLSARPIRDSASRGAGR